MMIQLKPCPFCGRGEVSFVEGALRHTVPHQRKCSLFHERTSDKAGARIEEFIEKNKGTTLEVPVVVTMKSWIGMEQPLLQKKFGESIKLLDHVLS